MPGTLTLDPHPHFAGTDNASWGRNCSDWRTGLGPASRSGLRDALQDGQNDRGTKQRPLQTKSPSGAFSFLIFILMNKVARWAESAPQRGPWRACCRGPRGQGPPLCAAASPWPGRRCPWCGRWVWGRGEGLTPVLAGPGSPGGVNNTHYLFSVLLMADRISETGPEEPALLWLPQVPRGPGPWPPPGPERWPGGPGQGRALRPPRRHRPSGASVSVS